MGRNRLIFLGSWKDKKNRFKLQQDKWGEEIYQNVDSTGTDCKGRLWNLSPQKCILTSARRGLV